MYSSSATLLEICVVALARFDIACCDTDRSLSQFILAISWDCRYANPAKNNPTTIDSIFITFFKAYPD
jgi:hypothetical protein